ncbi:DNA helicase HerA, contains HAS-barrel and ATPase domains [Anaerosporobacter mobilis DSM 15930]|uniref:DNA helicase HerA, contains HAS-barrel and ATPase domains n=1 Tax=Anaerosporobacter mobilis DSM 15930 TaxID=1120996 RepID=A0A1M7N1P0_9FIRM|nr:ATP-binding protein [Anaerosporobacter mobilis]SHM97433.1 DNA helicase HerA, contains HAS-barrel and ATPase domains [Anaerosporobacter mobilis DSM 15930]
MMKDSLEVRKNDELLEALSNADSIVMKKYMNDIANYPIKKMEDDFTKMDINSTVRFNKIEKLVFDSEEDNQDKLMNVYNSVALCGGSVFNAIVSDGKTVEYYIGTKSNSLNEIATCQATMVGTFEGNFPGSKLTLQKKAAVDEVIKNTFDSTYENKNRVVSVVSGIPSLRREDGTKESFIQGIEKVIDSMKGKKFALITISDPISIERMNEIRENYEVLYSQLSPFATTSLTYSESDSNAVAETITDGITKTVGSSLSNTITNSSSSTNGTNEATTSTLSLTPFGIGGSIGKTTGTSSSNTKQNGTSIGDTKTESLSDSRTTGKTDTYTNTSGRTLQINLENRRVSNVLKKIEKQIERIEDSVDVGLWNTATYCIADDSQTSKMLAGSMESLCRGEKSSIESFAIGTWSDNYKAGNVIGYLKKMSHPVLEMHMGNSHFDINPTSLINGKELVIEAGLPQKSISGVPVSEMVSFSRNIYMEEQEDSKQLKLGNIYHMGSVEDTSVSLNLESLSAHTLITGSTGSGKSNTVYQMLTQLQKEGIKFLVIEPAKGEYKHVFGNMPNVNVYGTNDKCSELLRINPFAFPEFIHVLEHVDRLIEIFNVCWPMYAAMPAVLKDAVLRAYENCGWDLERSENIYGNSTYPTFMDLQLELVAVINNSAYSEEVKGNYIGSLATRIKSLTNGINGQMFVEREIPSSKLFDENTIVDLSRVGSLETKSLIMGILVMKLNEYRMSEANGRMNQPFKHITVLEEAHNILKNSSNNMGGAEGSNISGKSVEMLSNSIAEVRTYGEGFIIVDQSPSAIDISAIRNTNTKIIMRLPEEVDRQQAGKASALKEKQIPELAKLPRGVAVVYQNNWLDPVLCKVHKANVDEDNYVYQPNTKRETSRVRNLKKQLLSMLMKNRVDEMIDYSIDEVEQSLDELQMATQYKIILRKTVEDLKIGIEPEICKDTAFVKLSAIVTEILGCVNHIDKFAQFGDNFDLLQQELIREINRNVDELSKKVQLAISQCIMRSLVQSHENQVELYAGWREFVIQERKMV